MIQSDFYKHGNTTQRLYAENLLKEYGNNFKWKNDGTDTLLDVGCGIGDITHDFVQKLMPSNYHRLIGIDISDDMLSFAKKNYENDKLQFFTEDITGDFENGIGDVKKFDHLTSMLVLHWTKNIRKSVSNISKLLTDTGDCIIFFVPWSDYFDFVDNVSQTIKWQDIVPRSKFNWKSNKREDMLDEFNSYLCEYGFKHIDTKLWEANIYFESKQEFQKFFDSFSAFHKSMSRTQQEELFDEFCVFNENTNGKWGFHTEFISGYARKV